MSMKIVVICCATAQGDKLDDVGLDQAKTFAEQFGRSFSRVFHTLDRPSETTAQIICTRHEQPAIDKTGVILCTNSREDTVIARAKAWAGSRTLIGHLSVDPDVANTIIGYGQQIWQKIKEKVADEKASGGVFLLVSQDIFVQAIGFAAILDQSSIVRPNVLAAFLHKSLGPCEGFNLHFDDNGKVSDITYLK